MGERGEEEEAEDEDMKKAQDWSKCFILTAIILRGTGVKNQSPKKSFSVRSF